MLALSFLPNTSIVRAVSAHHHVSRTSDNGGLWLLGAYASGASDGISVSKQLDQSSSHFQAMSITASQLGRKDSLVSTPTGCNLEDADDIDTAKLIGVGHAPLCLYCSNTLEKHYR